jgi:hypothetical protein
LVRQQGHKEPALNRPVLEAVVPGVFLLLEIITNIIFSIAEITAPAAYIIVNGILILVYVLIGYAVSRALKQTGFLTSRKVSFRIRGWYVTTAAASTGNPSIHCLLKQSILYSWN